MNINTKLTVVAALAGATAPAGARLREPDTARASRPSQGWRRFPARSRRASTPSPTMTTLTVKPDIAPAGKPFVVTGSGLPANQSVAIVWGTSNVTWVVDARPDSVDYLGRAATKVQVVLAQAQTDAQGQLSAKLDRAP